MHDDLLLQAKMLATVDAKKPRQVNLRRAVSSAYYAVFHFLIHESCSIIFGTQHAQAAYRNSLGRAFVHGVMNQACVSFGGGTLKQTVIKGLPLNAAGQYPVATAIRNLARGFVNLQEKRNRADYDRNERFERSEVLMLIEQTRDWVTQFVALPMSDDKRFFLACLWAWKELANR